MAYPFLSGPRSLRFKIIAALGVGLVAIAALAGTFLLLTEPGLREKMGIQGRNRVIAEYNEEGIISRYEELYRTVLNAPSAK